MVKLRDVVRGTPETITPSSTLFDAANAMMAADCGSMGVVVDGELIGILTERDILEAAAMGVEFTSAVVGNHMTRNPDVFCAEHRRRAGGRVASRDRVPARSGGGRRVDRHPLDS